MIYVYQFFFKCIIYSVNFFCKEVSKRICQSGSIRGGWMMFCSFFLKQFVYSGEQNVLVLECFLMSFLQQVVFRVLIRLLIIGYWSIQCLRLYFSFVLCYFCFRCFFLFFFKVIFWLYQGVDGCMVIICCLRGGVWLFNIEYKMLLYCLVKVFKFLD